MATKVQSSNAGKTKIAQLKKQTVVDIEPNNFKIEAWLTTAKRLTDKAEVAKRNGDLEEAYISYTKALTIALEKVPKHKDFKQAEKDRTEAYEQYSSFRRGIEEIFSEAEAVASTIEGLENINSSQTSPVSGSKQTFSEQDPIKMPEPPAHAKPASASSQPYLTVRTDNMPIASAGRLPSPVHIYALNTIGSIGPSSTPYGGSSLQPPSPLFHRLQSGNITPPQRSPGSSLPLNYAMPSPKPGTTFPIKSTISATELEEILFKTFERPRVLIVDIRVHSQFQIGHIKASDLVCIEPIILKDEISSLDIEHRLILSPEHERRMFAERHIYDLVVYHDQDSAQAPDPALNTQPAALLGREYPNALKNFVLAVHTNEFRKPLRRPPMLLIGGFNAWKRLVGERGIVKEQADLQTAPLRTLPSPQDKAKRNAMFVDDVVEALVTSPTTMKSNLQRHGAIGRGYAKDYLDFFRNRNGITKQSMTGTDFGQYNQQMPVAFAPTDAGPSITPFPMEMPSAAPTPVSSELQQPAKAQALQRRRTMTMMFDHPFYGFTHVDDPFHVTPPRPTRPLPTPPARSTASTIITKTGLPNLTNTCYMNAVVQVLRCTRPFAMYFVDGIYKKDRRGADTVNGKRLLGRIGLREETKALEVAFAELITALRGINATDAMVAFRSSVSANARAQGEAAWASNDQQDAQEFLSWLLWTLGDRVKKPPDEQKLAELSEMEKQRSGLSEEEISDLEWGKFYQNNRSIFVGIVGFIQRRRLECLNCHAKSSRFEPFLQLTVPIPAKTNSMMHRVRLHDCLDAEFATEMLSGSDAWKCEKCDPAAAGKTRESTLSKALLSLPNILIVHLNRFCFDPLLQQYGKLNNFVEFPLGGLDMSRYADTVNMKSHTSTTYNLYAVVNHLGATKSMGHYTSSIYDRGLDKWYRYDDRTVREISSAEMLFYVRDRVDFVMST